MAYSDKVLDHYENPRNVGSFAKSEEGVGTGMVGAPACGDVMKLQIKVGADGVIEDAKFKTYGCGSAIASSSTSQRNSRRHTTKDCAGRSTSGSSRSCGSATALNKPTKHPSAPWPSSAFGKIQDSWVNSSAGFRQSFTSPTWSASSQEIT